jgi:hypothetical protein
VDGVPLISIVAIDKTKIGKGKPCGANQLNYQEKTFFPCGEARGKKRWMRFSF